MIHLLEKPQSDDFTKNLITALTTTGEPQVGTALVKAFSALPMPQQEFAFEALIGRPEWTGLLLDSIESKSIDSKTFSPTRISRFTAHPDAGIAKRASMVFTSGAPPSGKDEMIAKLLPEMEKPANLSNGKQMFAAVCAVCHRLDDAGHVFGPDLGGIGSHPTLELLTHIVNPNLMVDDEHRTWNITMKDGTQFSALIASENEARLQIRQPGGVMAELKTDDVASREKGLNSLMPEGLEAMGAENVRDIIAYIRSCAPKTAPEK